MVELIANVNNAINGFVWGVPMLVLLVGTGILMTILTKFFQLSHIGHWFKNTVGGIFHDKHVTKHTDADDQSISQFQSLCTALAATIGTGNIVGVATAIGIGGPGAVFWMWFTGLLGMATKYGEAIEVSGKSLGQKKNTVDVTNTYNYVPTTGIIMNTLPYVLMIALCGVALIAFVGFKRRRLQK